MQISQYHTLNLSANKPIPTEPPPPPPPLPGKLPIMANNHPPMERKRSVKFNMSRGGRAHSTPAPKPNNDDVAHSSSDSEDEFEPKNSRFQVAAVGGGGNNSSSQRSSLVGRRSSKSSNEDGPNSRRPTLFADGAGYDSSSQTFGRNTLESLPHLDHYRNLFTTSANKGKTRPTLQELHELQMQVGDEL